MNRRDERVTQIVEMTDQPPHVVQAADPNAGGEDLYRPLRRLVAIDVVRQLSQLRPWLWVRDALVCWGFIVAAWALVAIHPAWWTVLIAIPVIGNRYYGLFILGHDALHRRAFSNPAWNDLFADLLVYAPICAITRINNQNHLSHHRHLASQKDPDRHKHGCFNKATSLQLFSFLTGFGSAFRSARNVFQRSPSGMGGEADSAPETPQSAISPQSYSLRDGLILLVWQATLFSGLTIAIGWWAYFVLWWIPVFVFAFLGDNLRSFLEHSQPMNDDAADAHRLITYTAPWWERMWIAPYQMNYHAVHHVWPSVPYYNLQAADGVLRAASEGMGLEWRCSYLAYLWRYLCRLPMPECRKRLEGPVLDESCAPREMAP